MAIEVPDGRRESNEVLEALRVRAVAAREKGYAVVEISDVLGVREETVSRWCVKYQQGGQEALPGDRTGRPVGSGRLVSPEQEEAIQRLIDTKTPKDLGIEQALWTRAAVRELIKQQTGQDLPIRTVGEYLNRWGYTPQKPVKKSYKQDPKEVAEWLDTKYPDIEKRAAQEGGEIHWGDETGVRSTCQHSRGYAKPQNTPELKLPGNRRERQHDLHRDQPGQGAVDDLPGQDERHRVHPVPDAADRLGGQEGLSHRRSSQRPRGQRGR